MLIIGQPEINTALVMHHKRVAEMGYYDGFNYDPPGYMQACAGLDETTGTRINFTRSAGMHTTGFFKNPDFNQCYHLSLSFFDPETHENRPHDDKLAELWCRAFFGRNIRWLWIEGAHSDMARKMGLKHYRLLMDKHYQRIVKPRREVYTREFTEAGWLSWSDLQYELKKQEGVVLR